MPRRGKRSHPGVRPLRGLAMTDVGVGLRLGFDFLCHCEGRRPVAIRPPNRVIARRPQADVVISGKYRSAEMFRKSVP